MYTATIWVKALNFTDEQLATLQSCTPPEAFIQHITAGSLDELAAPTPEDKPTTLILVRLVTQEDVSIFLQAAPALLSKTHRPFNISFKAPRTLGIHEDGSTDAADTSTQATFIDIPTLTYSTDLVVCIDHDRLEDLTPILDGLYDVWVNPLSNTELAYRFTQWQRHYQARMDAWETDQYLDATINSTPSLVWYKTRDGVHEKVNDSFCETVNKEKDDVQGKKHAYIWDVETDDPACIESEAMVMSTRKTCMSEEVVQTGSDDTRLLTTYKSPLYNPDGSVMGTVGVAIDITQERAYEHNLIENSETLETIFTSLECGVITHSLDGSQIFSINQAALDILGYESKEDLTAHGFNMVAPSVVEEDRALIKERIATLKHIGDSVPVEYRVDGKNGSIIHVMGSVKLIETNGIPQYRRFLLDITKQKEEEAQNERRQSALIQALAENYFLVCTFCMDTQMGEVVRIAHEGLEYALDPLFSATLSDGMIAYEGTLDHYIATHVYEEDQEMLRKALSRDNILNQLSQQNRFETLYRTQNNGMLEYRQASIVRAGTWDDGRDVILGLRNIDARIREELEQKQLLKEALTQANKANQAKSTFLTNMSHDIRTPMNAIVGFTALANSHIKDETRVLEYLDKIQASSNHLLSLINDILDMSRIESGKTTLEEAPCNIEQLLKALKNLLQPEADAKHLTLSFNTTHLSQETVLCDELKFNQVLLNLLGNALKFTPAGGTVSVIAKEIPCAQSEFKQYRIDVADTGIGMSPEFVDHIFDPFERERTSTISGVQGTGLGMAITKNLVEMMNGTISVSSQQGVGSTFTVIFTFPVSAEQIETNQAAFPINDHASCRFKGCRLLLVDDNDLNREIAATLLEDAGFIVEVARDGQESLEKLLKVDPLYYKAVLMDIQMPIMNGYEAARAIRAFDDPTRASIPILAVSADAFEEDRQKALRAGMNGHLHKPIDIDLLFQTLDYLLAESKDE